MIESSQTSPRELFATQLPLIEGLIGAAIRRHHLSNPDAEDFASTTRLRLLENDCSVLSQFQGRGSLAAFLTVVIERCYLDYRTACWGKWRPSSNARRIGPLAMALERLIVRDRLSCHEAYETLRINHGVTASLADLEALVIHLPVRPSRRPVDDSSLDCLFADHVDPETAVVDREAMERSMQALEQALARLRPSDRHLLEMRFAGQLTVAEIARRQGLEQKALYRHLRRILNRLRFDLQAQGISGVDAVAHRLEDIRLRWPASRTH